MADNNCAEPLPWTSLHFKGQKQRYGDFFYIWKVETAETDEKKVLDFCREQLAPRKNLPLYSEWSASIMVGGSKFGDADYYFRGWCKLERIDDGVYEFTVSEPYAD